MKLWHGSSHIIPAPQFGYGSPYNDYGLGFYCTEHAALAREWACKDGCDGFVNCYELATSGLRVLQLNEAPYSILHWLCVLLENRIMRLQTPIMERGAAWLKQEYHVDLAPYDAVVGYRADDSYFSFARAFLSNTITLAQLELAMQLGELGLQFVVKSERAFHALHFVESEPVSAASYYPLSASRDANARAQYQQLLTAEDAGQPTIRDLMSR